MTQMSEQDRGDLAILVMGIFEDWRLDPEEQLELIGRDHTASQRELTRWRHGTPLPDDEQMLERARHILGIHEALQVVFPRNPRQPAFWLRNRNPYFGTAPLAVMIDDGLAGMDWVWRHLDCTQGWR